MPYVRKYRRGARKAKMPYKRRAIRRNKPSGAFAKKVKAVIHKEVETKDVSYTLPYTDFNSPVSNVADVCRIIPNLEQGVTNGKRISDTVQGQKITVKGHMLINLLPNTTGTTIPTAIPNSCRIMVRAAICSIKKFNCFDDVSATTAWMNRILKNGNAVQGLDGSIQSMYLPWNRDVITVHKEFKKYITVPAIVAQTATAAGFSNTAVSFQETCKFFSATIKCKKILKYDDASFSPQNFAPFMIYSYCKLDNSSSDILVARVSSSYVSTLYYEDA